MTRMALAATGLLAIASAATAGPKPPVSSTFAPEIGYTYASGNYMDLRLANRTGSQAILVHRTAFGALGSFDLSDELSKRIAYQDGGRLHVRAWQKSGDTVSVTAPTEIEFGPGRAEVADFSPDGSKLAFSFGGSPDLGGVMVYDFNVADDPLTSERENLSPVLGGWQVFTVRWHPFENALLFVGHVLNDGQPPRIHRLDLGTGAVSVAVDGLSFPINFDVTRSWPLSVAGIVANQRDSSLLRLYGFDGTSPTTLAEGSFAHFNCRNDAIIHRAFAVRRPPTRITYLAGGFETWSTDSNIHHTDWMPRVPCA